MIVVHALGLWPDGAPARASYKGPTNADRRRAIMDELADSAGWLEIPDRFVDACVQTDDALDALICALVARASERGLVHPIPDADRDDAGREGWIPLPIEGALEGLR